MQSLILIGASFLITVAFTRDVAAEPAEPRPQSPTESAVGTAKALAKLDEELDLLSPRIDQSVKAGRYGEAEELAREILPLTAMRYGAGNWRVCSIRKSGECYAQAARLSPADQERVRRAVLMVDVGGKLLNDLKSAEAAPYFEKALKTLEELLGEQNILSTDAGHHYARVLAMNGDSEQAKKLGINVVRIRRDVSGGESLEFAHAVETLGDIYYRAGMLKEAEEQLRLADETYLKLFEKRMIHQRLLAVTCLVTVLNEAGKYEDAESFAWTAVEIAEKFKKNVVPRLYLQARVGLAQCLHGVGKSNEAAREFEQIVVFLAETSMPVDSETDVIRRYLVVLDALGRVEEAGAQRNRLRNLQQSLARRERSSEDELPVPPE